MNYSNPLLIALRRLAQKTKLLKYLVVLYRKTFNTGYEEKFDRTMLSLVRPGDVVWDIGANVGLFTIKFADLVTPTGQVHGFEPAPPTFETLHQSCAARSNIKCHNLALSNKSGEFPFSVSAVANDVTNRLADSGSTPAGSSVLIGVRTGDELVAAGVARQPNAIKIDVEGFECEVVEGLKRTLQSAALRNVFIEVHFSELNQRGLVDGPKQICTTLKSSGFKVEWVDPSHIVASRERGLSGNSVLR